MDIAEYDNGVLPASPSREYIYSDAVRVATIAGSSTTYHHSDHLSVRVSTDVSGTKIGEQGHYPYGEQWYAANSTKFLFTSYDRDAQTGLDYAMARFYVSRFGRFCSADPILSQPSDPQSWNRYSYVRNNPVNLVDPAGTDFMKWLIQTLLNFTEKFMFAAAGGSFGVLAGSAITPPIFDNGALSGTTATLNSIAHPGDPSRYIISNWSPAAHTGILECLASVRRFK